ncbi:hypothetical protein KBD75_02940 [Candidatus Woesebacteria bacterium]|nr:hypothetical protein [Candidatus Woesebacteria bacterium]
MNKEFFSKPWVKASISAILVAWIIGKIGVVYAINHYAGFVIDPSLSAIFVAGLIPWVLIICTAYSIESIPWKWIYVVTIVGMIVGVFAQTLSSTMFALMNDGAPLSFIVVTLEMNRDIMIYAIIISLFFSSWLGGGLMKMTIKGRTLKPGE